MPSPRLTVVLAAGQERARAREAVASVLGQSFRDLELIVVDTTTAERETGPLEDVAAADDRLVLVPNDRAMGAEEARDAGLDRATGEFVWFVEPTGVMPPGAAAAVARRLRETDPEILLLDDVRGGNRRPGPHGRFLRGAATDDVFTAERRPGAFTLAPDVWTMVFARNFLLGLGVRFASGGHGELTVTYPALLRAAGLSALDAPCWEQRDTSRLRNGSPLDVFDRYEEVVALVGATPPRALARAARRHLLGLFDDVPAPDRREFFSRMGNAFKALDTGKDPSLTERLVERGAYRQFLAARRSLDARATAVRRARRVSRAGKAMPRTASAAALGAYYRGQLRQPLDPELAVFAAYWYRGYSCNPRAIYERLGELAPGIRGVWVVGPRHAASMPPGVEYVLPGTRDYYRLVARATWFVNNVGFPEEVAKREGTVRIHTHHGTPLKTMGLDQRHSFVAGPRVDREHQVRRSMLWDYSISQSPFATQVWERAYPADYETLEVGHPRNDRLVGAGAADVERIRAELGIAPGKRTVLYAPTHREYLRRQGPLLDVGRLARELGSEYVCLTRLHYLAPGRDATGSGDRVLDVTRHPAIEDLFLAADVLVTDYSSVMFDYAVLDRPIVVHAPDWDEYRALRGTYFDLLAEPPGVVATTEDELAAAFRSGAVDGEEAAGRRSAFRARFCPLDDGRASERVVRRVWGKAATHVRTGEAAAAAGFEQAR